VVQASQVPFALLRPDPGLQVKHSPSALLQVKHPVQAAQTAVVPPVEVEKVSPVHWVHDEVFVRIEPASQEVQDPSVAEQIAQLGHAWQA